MQQLSDRLWNYTQHLAAQVVVTKKSSLPYEFHEENNIFECNGSASLALSAFALAAATTLITTTTTAPFSAYADQTKVYQSESGGTVGVTCDQQFARELGANNCSQLSKEVFGQPANPTARETCETGAAGEKCHQVK